MGDSRLCFRFVAGFGNSRLCRQCVPGFTCRASAAVNASEARYTLGTKLAVAETSDKSATKSTFADTVDFVASVSK